MYNATDTIFQLSNLCHIIHHTTGLNIALFNSNYELILSFTHIDYPFLTHNVYDTYKDDALVQLGHLNHSAAYLHDLPKASLIYYDIRIQVHEDLAFYACVGPALSEVYSHALILKVMHELKISYEFKEHICTFYHSLPYLGKQTANALWLSYHLLTTMPDTSDMQLLIESPQINIKDALLHNRLATTHMLSHSQIQFNYINESKWRHAVSRGDAKAAKKAYAAMSGNDFLYRTPTNPLRTKKNMLFTINTLCRAAAIDGGVDAVDVHKTHDLYTIRIENATTVLETIKIENTILDTYCNLVIHSHCKDFSPIVAKAISYLYAHYDSPLTLRNVASEIHCSEGHLSRTFQAETGKTLGAYLNELRIKEAISIMTCSAQSISDIALAVGFSSYNKFSIEFKKHTGKSATKYLQDLKIAISPSGSQ